MADNSGSRYDDYIIMNKKLIVIVGPTASGKTGLGVRLAKKLNGEVISADSRAIYRGMNLGTAKPTIEEQDEIKHWGIDLVDPDERFTAADFKKYVDLAITDIYARGKQPILVGGSGLYVDAVIYNYDFNEDRDQKLRERLNKLSVEELTRYCHENDIKLPENSKNKRYLVRAIEKGGKVRGDRRKMREDVLVVGIEVDKDTLMERITKRAEMMFGGGIEQETQRLAEKYSFDLEAMKSNIYPIVWRMLEGEISVEEARRLFIIDDWHLAKKQMTWFLRNKNIKWLPLNEIEGFLDLALEEQ